MAFSSVAISSERVCCGSLLRTLAARAWGSDLSHLVVGEVVSEGGGGVCEDAVESEAGLCGHEAKEEEALKL